MKEREMVQESKEPKVEEGGGETEAWNTSAFSHGYRLRKKVPNTKNSNMDSNEAAQPNQNQSIFK